MAPGKGAHLVLNEEIMAFLYESMEMVGEYYTDDVHDNAPESVILGLSNRAGWQEEKDNFGHKVFRSMPYKKGELRVTVVLTKQNELRIDIREWYVPQ